MPEAISCAPGLRLRQLLPEAEIFGSDDIAVRACTADSRACRDGDLFVAQIGTQVDGHDFVQEAIRNGAAAVLAERYLPVAGIPICVVPDSRVALGRICQ